MHLDHAIPWNTAANSFAIVRENPRCTPRTTDVSAQDSIDTNSLRHFCRVVADRIHEFGVAESSKITSLSEQQGDQLLSSEVCDRPRTAFSLDEHATNSHRHNPLSTQHQSLKYWIDRAKAHDPPTYTTADADLADAIKTLITIAATSQSRLEEEAFTAVLRLAKHPDSPLHQLDTVHWGHSFGVQRVREVTLQMYLMINLLEAIRERSGTVVPLCELQCFRRWAENALVDFDYPAQNLLHWRFWEQFGITTGSLAAAMSPDDVEGTVDPLVAGTVESLSVLKEYVKACFGILYRYDVLQSLWFGEEQSREIWIKEIEWFFKGWRADLSRS